MNNPAFTPTPLPRAPRPKKIHLNGWINLDKPAGITSTDALNQIKRALNVAKAGHGGTLDPLATGILPIALGEATKILPYVTDSLKEYTFTLNWGEQRTTDDSEGAVIATSDVRPSTDQITAALPAFTGEIMQLPPKFSALKINGERAYALARAGTDFTLEPRPVFIDSLTLLSTTPDTATLHCRCGKGTYIRSIARDLGEKLGTYAYISALRRTSVGTLTEKTAISLDNLIETVAMSGPQTVVLPLGAALDDIPALQLTQTEAARIKQGNAIDLLTRADVERLNAAGLPPQETDDALAVGFYDGVALALLSVTGPHVQPVRVFNP